MLKFGYINNKRQIVRERIRTFKTAFYNFTFFNIFKMFKIDEVLALGFIETLKLYRNEDRKSNLCSTVVLHLRLTNLFLNKSVSALGTVALYLESESNADSLSL